MPAGKVYIPFGANIDDVYAGAEFTPSSGNATVQWTNNINNSTVLGVENGGELHAAEDPVGGVAAYGAAGDELRNGVRSVIGRSV